MATANLEKDEVCHVNWDGYQFVANSKEYGKLGSDIDFDSLRRKLENRGWSVKTSEVVKVRFDYR